MEDWIENGVKHILLHIIDTMLDISPNILDKLISISVHLVPLLFQVADVDGVGEGMKQIILLLLFYKLLRMSFVFLNLLWLSNSLHWNHRR